MTLQKTGQAFVVPTDGWQQVPEDYEQPYMTVALNANASIIIVSELANGHTVVKAARNASANQINTGVNRGDWQCRRHKRHGFSPWVGKIPWRKASQPTLVFLFGECHGQRSQAGYSPWGHKESDMTEQLTLSLDRKSVV